MAQIKVKIPRRTFQKFSGRFTSEKAARDYLEIKLDNLLRRQRKAIQKDLEDDDFHIELDLYIVDVLVPVLEEYERRQKKPLRAILYKIIDNML
jgi:hypothetical protein